MVVSSSLLPFTASGTTPLVLLEKKLLEKLLKRQAHGYSKLTTVITMYSRTFRELATHKYTTLTSVGEALLA